MAASEAAVALATASDAVACREAASCCTVNNLASNACNCWLAAEA